MYHKNANKKQKMCPQIYIYSFCLCLIYNKVYVITF